MKKLLSLILISFLLPTLCFGWNELYVDCKNGNDANTGLSEGAAWLTVHQAAHRAVAGDRVNIEYDGNADEECNITTPIVFLTNGAADNPIVFQGYAASAGDGTDCIIDGTSTSGPVLDLSRSDNLILKDIEIKGSTSDGIYINADSDYGVIESCYVHDNADNAIQADGNSAGWRIFGNEFSGGNDTLVIDSNDTYIFYNYIHDAGDDCFYYATNNGMVFGNILDTCVNRCFYSNYASHTLVENTLYNSTGSSNVYSHQVDSHVLINNIFDTAADHNVDGGVVLMKGYNSVSNDANGAWGTAAAFDLGGEQTAAPGFDGAAAGDFNIDGTLDDDGYPNSTWPGGLTTANEEIGACSYEETGGGGSTGGAGWMYVH